ncbi:MAG: GDP-mannose 4,6-dehydratase [Elusimicrobia bacterium]|nr:GDP-mannose 4,6-dehydratase [Elusimicrobiota bacterium]
MNWKNARVLVTGAGGFIGSHLSEELARRGARVRALVRYNSRGDWGFLEKTAPALLKRIEVRLGDVSDPYCVREMVGGQEAVFHLAALIGIPYSYLAPEQYVSTNVQGTLNVLESCRRQGVRRMIHTSTSEVYGTARYAPIDEAHPLQGQSPYSASKIAADALVDSFHRSFGLPATIVRPFNTYGPRQSARAILPTIISQLLKGAKALDLGSLTPVRDFNYVGDTVEGFLAAAASPKAVGQTINIGSGRARSVGDAVKDIQKLLGTNVPVRTDKARVRPAKSEVFKLICDNRKARKLTGWRPRYSFEEGLVNTIAAIRSDLGRYKAGYAV